MLSGDAQLRSDSTADIEQAALGRHPLEEPLSTSSKKLSFPKLIVCIRFGLLHALAEHGCHRHWIDVVQSAIGAPDNLMFGFADEWPGLRSSTGMARDELSFIKPQVKRTYSRKPDAIQSEAPGDASRNPARRPAMKEGFEEHAEEYSRVADA
jgi:hypothetical protein